MYRYLVLFNFSAYFFAGFFFLPMLRPASSRSSKFSSFFLLFFGLTGPAAAAGFWRKNKKTFERLHVRANIADQTSGDSDERKTTMKRMYNQLNSTQLNSTQLTFKPLGSLGSKSLSESKQETGSVPAGCLEVTCR